MGGVTLLWLRDLRLRDNPGRRALARQRVRLRRAAAGAKGVALSGGRV